MTFFALHFIRYFYTYWYSAAAVTQISTWYNSGMQKSISAHTTHQTLKGPGYSRGRPSLLNTWLSAHWVCCILTVEWLGHLFWQTPQHLEQGAAQPMFSCFSGWVKIHLWKSLTERKVKILYIWINGAVHFPSLQSVVWWLAIPDTSISTSWFYTRAWPSSEVLGTSLRVWNCIKTPCTEDTCLRWKFCVKYPDK